jgi:ADP-heptose:LPS heptosyltransferase
MSVVTRVLDQLDFYWPTPSLLRLAGEPLFRLAGRRSKNNFSLAHVRSVLVVRTDEIGDVVLTTPFLRELRRSLPDAWITLIVKPAVLALMQPCPYVDEVLPFAIKIGKWSLPFLKYLVLPRFAYRHLWRRRFDMALSPRWDTDSCHATWLMYFSGAPWRVGFSERTDPDKSYYNHNYDRLRTHSLDDSTLKHEVERDLDLLRFVGARVQEDRLEIWLQPDDVAHAQHILSNNGVLESDLKIAVVPGALRARKIWPKEKYAELGHWLRRALGARIVLIGGADEAILGDALHAELGDGVINQMGKTTLRQAAALLQQCDLYVGNDTGPMHIAAALGLPAVEISCHPRQGSPGHAHSSLRFGPWKVPFAVVQPQQALHPCRLACDADHAHCIATIDVDSVRQAIETLLARGDFAKYDIWRGAAC